MEKKVYRNTAQYAREHGELDQYRESYRLNDACRKAIDEGISSSFDGYRLANGPEHKVLEKFGEDRVTYVLANTLQQMEYDGRFSPSNKAWAKTIDVTPADHNVYLICHTHPAVMDGFVNKVRKLIGARKENET